MYLEKWSFVCHFREDATNWPDVDGAWVLAGSQEDFRGSVPQGDDLVSVHPDWDTESPSQTEVSNFDSTGFVDQQVLGFQISVQYASLVTEKDGLWDGIGIRFKHISLYYLG